MAEFVDNSIQATHVHTGSGVKRAVDVSFYVDTQRPDGDSSYVAITDNGIGMDKAKIQQFATFALSQSDRGFTVEAGKSMISKFGVGAKNAG